MDILIVEDYGIVYNALYDNFKEIGTVDKVMSAFQVSEAMDKFNLRKINFLIVDLYLPPSGLTKTETDKTEGGTLSGWFWLQNYVFKNNPKSVWRKRVIIYSDYIKILKEKIPNGEWSGIKLLSKSSHEITDVVTEFKKMTN
jgi:hypothetical protein